MIDIFGTIVFLMCIISIILPIINNGSIKKYKSQSMCAKDLNIAPSLIGLMIKGKKSKEYLAKYKIKKIQNLII